MTGVYSNYKGDIGMNPWVVGWIASDGHNAGSHWSISQNIDDSDALYLIYQMYPDVSFNIMFESKNRYGSKPMVTIRRKSLLDCSELSLYGIPVGEKTFTLTFPTDVPDSFLWEYFRGFFEGDGSIGIEKYRYPKLSITTSKLWCDGCKEWLKKHNIVSCVVPDKRNTYCISVHSISGVRTIIEKIYHDKVYHKLGRKYSLAMKILLLLKYWENKKEKNLRISKLDKDIKSAINSGMSASSISETLKCSLFSVSKTRLSMGFFGHRSNNKISEIQDKLQQGLDREDVVKMGYGRKIVHKAFRLLYGDPKLIKEKRDAEIRDLILSGLSVKEICHRMQCGEGKVIKEKRYLFSLGHDIKLNNVKSKEKNIL